VYCTGYSYRRGGQLQDRASLEKLLLASGFTGRISEFFASNSTIKVRHYGFGFAVLRLRM
jgi:hypothetical protein